MHSHERPIKVYSLVVCPTVHCIQYKMAVTIHSSVDLRSSYEVDCYDEYHRICLTKGHNTVVQPWSGDDTSSMIRGQRDVLLYMSVLTTIHTLQTIDKRQTERNALCLATMQYNTIIIIIIYFSHFRNAVYG